MARRYSKKRRAKHGGSKGGRKLGKYTVPTRGSKYHV